MAIVMDAQERKLAAVAGHRLRLAGRQGCHRHGGRPAQSSRAAPSSWPSTASTSASLAAAAEAQRQKAATVIFVGVDGKLAGFVAIADPIKATTPQALQALKAAGIRIVMLTGDGKTTAEAVGRELGIDEVVAEVFPEDKAAVVQRLKSRRPCRRHGGRRCQRRARPGGGRRRHRDGHRDRRRHGERGRHAAQGRPDGHRSGADALAARPCATSGRTCS